MELIFPSIAPASTLHGFCSQATSLRHRALQLLDEGTHAWEAGNIPEALYLYGEGIRSDDSVILLYAKRYNVLVAAHNFERALEDARRIVDLAPQWPQGYSYMALACAGLRNYDAALAAYAEGLGVAPGDPGLLNAQKTLANMMHRTRRASCLVRDIDIQVEEIKRREAIGAVSNPLPLHIPDETDKYVPSGQLGDGAVDQDRVQGVSDTNITISTLTEPVVPFTSYKLTSPITGRPVPLAVPVFYHLEMDGEKPSSNPSSPRRADLSPARSFLVPSSPKQCVHNVVSSADTFREVFASDECDSASDCDLDDLKAHREPCSRQRVSDSISTFQRQSSLIALKAVREQLELGLHQAVQERSRTLGKRDVGCQTPPPFAPSADDGCTGMVPAVGIGTGIDAEHATVTTVSSDSLDVTQRANHSLLLTRSSLSLRAQDQKRWSAPLSSPTTTAYYALASDRSGALANGNDPAPSSSGSAVLCRRTRRLSLQASIVSDRAIVVQPLAPSIPSIPNYKPERFSLPELKGSRVTAAASRTVHLGKTICGKLPGGTAG